MLNVLILLNLLVEANSATNRSGRLYFSKEILPQRLNYNIHVLVIL